MKSFNQKDYNNSIKLLSLTQGNSIKDMKNFNK